MTKYSSISTSRHLLPWRSMFCSGAQVKLRLDWLNW